MLRNLPTTSPDPHAGIAVIDMEFETVPDYTFASYYPRINAGADPAGDLPVQ